MFPFDDVIMINHWGIIWRYRILSRGTGSVHHKKYAHDLRFVMFVLVNHLQIVPKNTSGLLQCYWLRAIAPSASEDTTKNIGNICHEYTRIDYTTTTRQSQITVCLSYDMFHIVSKYIRYESKCLKQSNRNLEIVDPKSIVQHKTPLSSQVKHQEIDAFIMNHEYTASWKYRNDNNDKCSKPQSSMGRKWCNRNV